MVNGIPAQTRGILLNLALKGHLEAFADRVDGVVVVVNVTHKTHSFFLLDGRRFLWDLKALGGALEVNFKQIADHIFTACSLEGPSPALEHSLEALIGILLLMPTFLVLFVENRVRSPHALHKLIGGNRLMS